MLSWGQVGVAEVPGRLQNPDDPLHVAGETEAAVGHDQQLHDWNGRTEGLKLDLEVPSDLDA